MNLGEQLEQALASWPLFQHGDATVSAEQPGLRLSCALVALDSLACAFTSLCVASDRLAGVGTARLTEVAQNLAKRLTYLLEPISPIESDAEGCVVQMRSMPPKTQPDQIDYYELLVSREGLLSLVRYSRAKGSSRTAIPAQVTREVLVRLAMDFAAAGG